MIYPCEVIFLETIKRLNEVSLLDFVKLVNEIFKDYKLPVNWDVYTFKLDAKENSLSFEDSFVFYEDGYPTGFIVVGIRKNRARIDAMGVIREKRGTGLASRILEHAVENLKWKAVNTVILEVIEEDERAVRFYQKNGFKVQRKLYTLGFEDQVMGTPFLRFFKTDARWVHKIALEVQINNKRKPNWQREPLTLFLSDERYNMERVAFKGREGYLVWGTTPTSAFIVDCFMRDMV
ncbi:MAG TPA: GNAT family N-acetyltransferase, partial [Thermotoga sp.]|nr:GNAT family N-acetyltransferase [Thermotoga sp.]